ncbi:MAG: hypothetical protein CMH58_08900 [Myxococcales bacterium]|nr:hypothetical protein [Myxococcales bacterium]
MMPLRFLLVLTMLISLPTSVDAHRPQTFDADEIITDPLISWTLPGTFETGAEVFEFDLDYDEPFTAPFEIFAPTSGGNGDFRPRYAVIGPGFPEATDAVRSLLPDGVTIPEDAGVFLETNEREDRFVFFEGVMRRVLVSSGTIALRLAAGQHKVVIWAPENQTGRFMFGFGVEENFEGGGFNGVFENWSTFAY